MRHGNSRLRARGNGGTEEVNSREDTNSSQTQLDMQASQLTFYFQVFQVLHAVVSQIQV